MQTISAITAANPAPRPDARGDVQAELALTRDALTKLGKPMTAQDVVRARHEAEQPGNVGVPVGTNVFDEPGGNPWIVIGATDGQLDAARLDPTGKLERTRAPFASFAEHTLELLGSAATVDGRRGAEAANDGSSDDREWLPLPGYAEDVRAHGRNARVTLIDADPLALLIAKMGGDMPTHFETNWDDVLKSRKAETLRAVALLPDEPEQAQSLRQLVGDRTMVDSALGERGEGRRRLVGTESKPGAGKPVLDEVQRLRTWFDSVAGVKILPEDATLIAHENNHEFLANAAAGTDGEGNTHIFKGPRDENVRQTWLREFSGKSGQAMRHFDNLVNEHADAVMPHEWGHALRGRLWSQPFNGVENLDEAKQRQVIEHHMVNEALSDLYGVAHAKDPDIGVRRTNATQKGSGDLGQYRELLASTPVERMDEHFGTQLLTKPALHVAKQHGYDALAAIVGAADHDLGALLKNGDIQSVDVPTAANALYGAAARRWGVKDDAVEAMRATWERLDVPVRGLD